MSVMESKERQAERKRQQAKLRRDRMATVAPQQSAEIAAPTDNAFVIESAAPAVPTERDNIWRGYCKHVANLHRRPGELAQFKIDLEGGRRPDVTEPALMTAALHLVGGMSAAGVRRGHCLPAPTVDELADPAVWATRRLADQRLAQDAADRIRRGQQQLARALGAPRSAASGAINPVHLQDPKRSLDEMAERLERAMSRDGFQREWLDHRSPNYISDRDGGISNKQIVLMANLIVGRKEQRSFDDNWKIVTDFLVERRKQRDEQAAKTA
jgi:cell pole-organizing protein PopZ